LGIGDLIVEQLNIVSRECVAVVGAGGKTSLCWLLAQEIAARGERVIFTTTTRIRMPQATAFDVIAIGATPAEPPGDWRTACIASGVDGVLDNRPLFESLMPVVATKLAGFGVEPLDALHHSCEASLLVEADGARGLMLKAPAAYEPVIPSRATTVCVVANLAVLGQPLDERVAHRPERVAQLTGLRRGDPIVAEAMAALLAHPDGGLKGIPAGARRVAVLMQHDPHAAHPDAAFLVQTLVDRGYAVAIALSPRAQPLRVMALATRP